MKKGFKLTIASAMAVSALTPAAVALADEKTEVAATGFYTTDSFFNPEQFKDLSQSEQQELLANEELILVISGTVYFAKDAIGKSDAELEKLVITQEQFEEQYGKIGPSGYELEAEKLTVESVSAINATTVEVTFNETLTAVEASQFTIAGLQVTDAAFKPETDNKVVVLTTSNQEVQEYTLNYTAGTNESSRNFIGKASLGTVLLKTATNQYEYEIDPNQNVLPTVEIVAELSDEFPEGAEAVIEFETSFGQVVEVQTTKGGKTTFTLTPEKTLFSQTARVTGKVIEVKNDKTGETFPEFRNAAVGTINVKFNVKTTSETSDIKVYNFGTAYAEQADRIALRLEGADTADLEASVKNSPQAKIAALGNGVVAQQGLDRESLVKKELYTHLHDVLFSNISDIVDDANAAYTADELNKSDALRQAEDELNKFFNNIEAKDLRNALYADAIGVTVAPAPGQQPNYENYDLNRYEEVYKNLVNDPFKLRDLVNEISLDELDEILDYYKLLSKFIVLDNVRDVEKPQSPDEILAVESLYLEQRGNEKAVVLVLPADRSLELRDHSSRLDSQDNRHDQRKDAADIVEASQLTDNVSHQVVFLNNIEKDRYQLSGAPAFKLEDANNVNLISVTTDNMRYKVQPSVAPGVAPTPTDKTIYCPIPFSVDVEESSLGGGDETGGGVIDPTRINPYFVVSDKTLTAEDYTISDYFMKAEIANSANDRADKLGEVLVVFSESVSTKGANSVLNPANWSIDGKRLSEAAAEYDAEVHIRLVSTDVTKQLRDAVIITFTSSLDGNQVVNSELVDRFVEAYHGPDHKLEVRNITDWAGVTDTKNIVPTQTLDYDAATNAEDWSNAFTEAGSGGGGGTADPKLKHVGIEGTNAFVVRAAAQADVTQGINAQSTDTKDIVRILFSEPMQITGSNSVLNKEAYKINGQALPVEGTSINFGLKGVEGMEDSLCGVTIELPNGTLEVNNPDLNGNENIIAVSNVKGQDDAATFVTDLQLAYARDLTLVSDEAHIGYNNGLVFDRDYDYVNGFLEFNLNHVIPGTLTNVSSVEGRVYVDENGDAIKFTTEWINSPEFFTTHVNGTVAGEPGGSGEPVDKVELQSAVETANEALTNTNAEDYAEGAYETFKAAVAEAQAVLDAEASQEEVDTAVAELTAAVEAFEAAKKDEGEIVEDYTLSEVNSEAVETLIPNAVFNIIFDLADLQAKDENATADSVVTLVIEGKEPITLGFRAANNKFNKLNVQGYTQAELENAIVTVQ